ncbi:hypothetical protein AZE42_13395 [Rhizopogon vesiculosus]|uniref:Uncharacterized protein n=1 Tax=Rhizopogon vesiculosus TaxID=180088 RepID=A0A1J8QS77_9AGAM|nr:hypothetical protein AZE42_13395 [Rhizopogon vesiculosus]
MQWANYWHNVVQHYRVMIEDWPDNFPFANLSAVSHGLPELENLLRKWRSGAIFWKHLTSDEFEHLQKEHEEKIESGDIVERCRCPHSDRGKKRRREGGDDSGRQKKSHKSAETVDTDSEDEQPQDPTPPSTLPPLTQTTASDGTLLLPPQTPTNVPESNNTLPPLTQTSNTFPESDGTLPPPAQTPHDIPESEGALPSAQPASYPPSSDSALPPAHWTLNGATSSASGLPVETLHGIPTGLPDIDMDLIISQMNKYFVSNPPNSYL